MNYTIRTLEECSVYNQVSRIGDGVVLSPCGGSGAGTRVQGCSARQLTAADIYWTLVSQRRLGNIETLPLPPLEL